MSLQIPVAEADCIHKLGSACTDLPVAISEIASPDFLSLLLPVIKMLLTGISTFLSPVFSRLLVAWKQNSANNLFISESGYEFLCTVFPIKNQIYNM